jgi:tetratricopeptide (TPR) repeat protein
MPLGLEVAIPNAIAEAIRRLGDAIAEAIRWLGNATGWITGDAADWVAGLLAPAIDILDSIWPPVLAGIAVIFVLRGFRWLVLLVRGRTPRVQISTFAWAMPGDGGQEATWVTSLFREQLSALRLDALDPLPERAPGAPLVEIVEGVGQGVGRDIAGAAGRLFKAALPDSAYEVWGTLRPREGGGGRISVQLIERRRGNRTLLNVALEQASWEDGAREAAMAVAGALYPEVRRKERGPWTSWERPVPRGLMRHYHAARNHEEANRLEQALAEYHAALDQDPLNPNIRLKIAMLQERLELYLDAWVTYEAIVDESDRRAWRGPDRRAFLLALFRLAVMLSNGRIAAQWVKASSLEQGKKTTRDKERDERRRELLRSLESATLFSGTGINPARGELPDLLTRAASTVITRFPSAFLLAILRTFDQKAKEPSDVLDAFRHGGEYKDRERQIEAVLQILCLRRLEELEFWERIHFFHPRYTLRRPEFARSTIKISKLLARTRIAASLESQVERCAAESQGFSSRDRWIAEMREAHRKLTRHWPFPAVSQWRRFVHFLAPRRRLAYRREDAWQLHYNAACTAASVLRDDSVLRNATREKRASPKSASERRQQEQEERAGTWMALPKGIVEGKIVKEAIDQLESYAFKAGSDRVAAQADWVALDDPDLRGLRRAPAFQLWASHHLPRTLPEGVSMRKADVKRFTVRVIQEGACLFSRSWRERAVLANPSAAEIVDWWRVEAQVWTGLRNTFLEHLSWQERLKWLDTLQGWLDEAGTEDQVDFSYEARGAAGTDLMCPELFDELAVLVKCGSNGRGANGTDNPPSVLAWVDERAQHVRTAHESGEEQADKKGDLRVATEHAEALRAARVWTRLAEMLEAELNEPSHEDSAEQRRARERELKVRVEQIRGVLLENAGPNGRAARLSKLVRGLPAARPRLNG